VDDLGLALLFGLALMYGYVVCGSVLGAPRTLLCKMVESADSVIGSGIDLRCVRWCPNSGLSGFGLSVQHSTFLECMGD